jgi:hypothetical protein
MDIGLHKWGIEICPSVEFRKKYLRFIPVKDWKLGPFRITLWNWLVFGFRGRALNLGLFDIMIKGR